MVGGSDITDAKQSGKNIPPPLDWVVKLTVHVQVTDGINIVRGDGARFSCRLYS